MSNIKVLKFDWSQASISVDVEHWSCPVLLQEEKLAKPLDTPSKGYYIHKLKKSISELRRPRYYIRKVVKYSQNCSSRTVSSPLAFYETYCQISTRTRLWSKAWRAMVSRESGSAANLNMESWSKSPNHCWKKWCQKGAQQEWDLVMFSCPCQPGWAQAPSCLGKCKYRCLCKGHFQMTLSKAD